MMDFEGKKTHIVGTKLEDNAYEVFMAIKKLERRKKADLLRMIVEDWVKANAHRVPHVKKSAMLGKK